MKEVGEPKQRVSGVQPVTAMRVCALPARGALFI